MLGAERPMATTHKPVIPISEREFMSQVIEMARFLGYLVYHPYDSRHSTPGFPDLTMIKPGCDDRPGRIIFAELKSTTGRVTLAQKTWLEALKSCTGIEVYLWRPADFDSIVECLKREIP